MLGDHRELRRPRRDICGVGWTLILTVPATSIQKQRAFCDRIKKLLSLIQAPDQPHQRHLQRITNPQQCLHRNRSAHFDLLPASGRETKLNHVLLSESPSFAKLADTSSQRTEECGFIGHARVLVGHEQKYHEQISWPCNTSRRALSRSSDEKNATTRAPRSYGNCSGSGLLLLPVDSEIHKRILLLSAAGNAPT